SPNTCSASCAMPLIDLLGHNAQLRGERTFLVLEQQSYSYIEIHDAALRFATLLRGLGARPGQHVALIAENSAAYIVAWFGLSAAGCVAVTLNTQLVGEGLSRALAHSDATILVGDASWFDSRHATAAVPAGLPRVLLEDDAGLLLRLRQHTPAAPVAVS